MARRSNREESTPAIIVESPAKVRTIQKFLGDRFKVLSSVGHVRDLPENKLGVDVEHDFQPQYQVIPRQRKTIKALRKGVDGARPVYLASDPDREGEAIAWHLAQTLELEDPKRITFNEITKRAVEQALKSPGSINMDLVNAQQARRVLDRLVGYEMSPILWKRIKGRKDLSAGRVQSVALRLVCEREREIRAFRPEESWRISAELMPDGQDESFQARLVKIHGEDPKIPSAEEAKRVRAAVSELAYSVAGITKKRRLRNAPPPFRTSVLQQQASSRLGFSARKTMMLAQQLYEGVELGAEGAVALITYMRTDSTRVSETAKQMAKQVILERFGDQYLGTDKRKQRAVRGAQEAHEAIRPTDPARDPDQVAPYLTKDQLALYRLIWSRFLGSQMAPAQYEQTTVDIAADGYDFRATASILVFPGFMAAYEAGADKEAEESDNSSLPDLKEGQPLKLLALRPSQHFTKPPPRYNEGSLVRALEDNGIGRPSTYAPIVETLRRRRYVRMDGRNFVPTPLGFAVSDFLVEHFPEVMDVEFTAGIEKQLDEVEAGKREWVDLLKQFYEGFQKAVKHAQTNQPRKLEEKCPVCGGELVERISEFGKFIGCSNYPDCQYTRREDEPKESRVPPPYAEPCPKCGSVVYLERRDDQWYYRCLEAPDCDFEEKVPQEKEDENGPIGEKCPECGRELVVRTGRNGKFIGCSGYPECTYTRNLHGERKARKRPARQTNIKCDKCGKPMVIRTSKRGKFLGCSGYPKCRNTMPIEALDRNESDEDAAHADR